MSQEKRQQHLIDVLQSPPGAFKKEWMRIMKGDDRIRMNQTPGFDASSCKKLSKKARLDAVEIAYLGIRESVSRLRNQFSGIFDMVVDFGERLEAVEKQTKLDRNAIAQLNSYAQLQPPLHAVGEDRCPYCGMTGTEARMRMENGEVVPHSPADAVLDREERSGEEERPLENVPGRYR